MTDKEIVEKVMEGDYDDRCEADIRSRVEEAITLAREDERKKRHMCGICGEDGILQAKIRKLIESESKFSGARRLLRELGKGD